MGILKKLRLWGQRKPTEATTAPSQIFRVRYAHFKELLASNTELLNIITDLEEKLQGQMLFGMSYVRSQSTRAVFHTLRMVHSLNALSGERYRQLFTTLDEINRKVKEEVGQKKEVAISDYVLPYSRITKEMVDWVGGKSANLGEVLNLVRLPIPDGFAITTRAFHAFLAHSGLPDEINKRQMEVNPDEPETVKAASKDIQGMILAAPLPTDVEEAIRGAYARLAEASGERGHEGAGLRVALRSSAIGEDSALTFAGQYQSALNVSSERLVETYKTIVASLYTPRAMVYRLSKGIRDEDIAMGVACLAMVEAVASGVIYSRDPVNILEDTVIINAVWGLGPYLVDGVLTPDSYRVGKGEDHRVLQSRIAHKPVQLTTHPEGGLGEIPVAAEDKDKPCLSSEQIRVLADYAVKLEGYYGGPQDIEWALDRQGRLLVLQARPLPMTAEDRDIRKEAVPKLTAYPLLVEGGTAAFRGVGAGPAYLVSSEEDLMHFPDGAVLVAKRSSPRFVLVMRKAQAIVTDAGSVTGHMASLAREFRVPSLLDTKVGTAAIAPGTEITVDAYSGRVYQGKVEELLALRVTREPRMQGTPVYQTLRQVADVIVPLHLLDPKDPSFSPESCRSLHDIMRFVHELSYSEMFQLSDLVSYREGGAVKLDAHLPIDLHLIDLGGGLTGVSERAKKVNLNAVSSAPLRALLRGMTREDLSHQRPRPIELSGFFSVMREQMLGPADYGERFGDRSYAIISDKYLNFSSRVGFHYSVLDSYCGQTINKNYITFSFKGGAADDVRRNRRARAIALVLQRSDFTVEVRGDRVDARFQKYERPVIEEKLDMVGRLLQFTRQMDMLMKHEASVPAIAESFLAGNYRLDPDFFARQGAQKQGPD